MGENKIFRNGCGLNAIITKIDAAIKIMGCAILLILQFRFTYWLQDVRVKLFDLNLVLQYSQLFKLQSVKVKE
jgi:hypothetical protein